MRNSVRQVAVAPVTGGMAAARLRSEHLGNVGYESIMNVAAPAVV
jgi:hypothetical protein